MTDIAIPSPGLYEENKELFFWASRIAVVGVCTHNTLRIEIVVGSRRCSRDDYYNFLRFLNDSQYQATIVTVPNDTFHCDVMIYIRLRERILGYPQPAAASAIPSARYLNDYHR